MRKKHEIAVYDSDDHVNEVVRIKRVLTQISVGNFYPMYCRYRGQKYFVHSMEGDLSDPFRRVASYFSSLYIELEESPSNIHRGEQG